MNPYNERLPLIDAAIKQGLKQEPGHYVFFGKGVARFYYGNNLCSDKQDFICTRDEFNQRAKELGYINGYKYGVEYETNGEKPDLPDDVWVHGMFDGQWLDHGDECNTVKYWNWSLSEKFRIVDDRFKPKGQYMNEYNPAVGDVVIAIDKRVKSDGNKCELRYMGADVCVLYDIYDDCEFAVHPHHVEFRPLRTETDELVELVEQAKKDFVNADVGSYTTYERKCIEALINAGYRKIKPMSEQEFIKQCVVTCDSGDTRLYRAGCRFLDQGE